MRIKALHVKNFRSLKDVQTNCDHLTALVGPNGAGKSCLIRALELFYSPSPNITADDFYNREQSHDIEIAVTFADLSLLEISRFRSRIHEGLLPVIRVLSTSSKNHGRYFGFAYRNREFDGVRELGGREQITAYAELRTTDRYKDSLPAARSQAAIAAALEAWEADSNNREALELLRDDGQFFGFQNVARGYLNDVTRFIFVPAVRDAAEDVREGRGSPITLLMDLVVRATLATNKEIAALKETTQARYLELTRPEKLPALGGLATTLSATLQTYYQNTDVSLDWLPPEEIVLPPPKADVRLVEDKFQLPVAKVGHGLQRAFILTLLQHLAVAREQRQNVAPSTDVDTSETDAIQPELNLILGIEEPELYQHPNRQRHFARILYELAQGRIPGVAAQTQVIYATHSPLFVGIDRFDNVRRCTRGPGATGAPRTTAVIETSWDAVAEKVWNANGCPNPKFTADTLRPRVMSLLTPWTNEGFFADVAVLVEGEGDRATLLGIAKALRNCDLKSNGCAIIPCDGKGNLDKATAIFEGLGIPTYTLWDSDKSKGETSKLNRTLLRLLGFAEEDWPAFVSDRCACFEDKLEVTLQQEIGQELFNDLLEKAKSAYGISKNEHAKKNPLVLTELATRAAEKGKVADTVLAIVDRILDLRSRV